MSKLKIPLIFIIYTTFFYVACTSRKEARQDFISNLPWENFENTTQSPQEWITYFKQYPKKAPDDPAFREIWQGASVFIHGHFRNGFINGDNLFGRPLTSEEELQLEAYNEFWGIKGQEIFQSWLTTGELTDQNQKYYYILNGICFSEYFKTLRPKKALNKSFTNTEQQIWDYSHKIMHTGNALLKKIYRTQMISGKEINQLRLYAMWADITSSTWAYTESNNFLPFHIGLTRPFHDATEKMVYSLSGSPAKEKYGFEKGEQAPDFNLFTMESVLKSPSYSDFNPFETAKLLKPLVMFEILNALAGYELKEDESGNETLVPKSHSVNEAEKEGLVRLSSFRGKKPVLLILADPTDAWAWHFHLAEQVDGLHKVYGDQVEFLLIYVTVRDGYMPVYDFFSPQKAKMVARHPLTMEERARTAKMFYMGHPQITIPCLLDDMGQTTRNKYMDLGGSASMYLVDINGKIAYRDMTMNDRKDELPIDNDLPCLISIRINALEKAIRRLIANEGKELAGYGKDNILVKPKNLITDGQIIKIDHQLKQIKLKRLVSKPEELSPQDSIEAYYISTNYPYEPDDKIYTVQVNEQTRIASIRDGRFLHLTFNDLIVGQKINVESKELFSDDESLVYSARYLFDDNLRAFHKHRFEKESIWFYGEIIEIDIGHRMVTVKMPGSATNEMKGYSFWKEAGERASLIDRTKMTVPIVNKWVEGTGAERTYRFVIDDAVDIYYNGEPANIEKFELGDKAVIEFFGVQDGQSELYPDVFRVSTKAMN